MPAALAVLLLFVAQESDALRGRVVGPDGNAVSGATVQWSARMIAGANAWGSVPIHVSSDDDGEFLVPESVAGKDSGYIRVAGTAFADYVGVVDRSDGPMDLGTIRLHREHSIEIVILDEEGDLLLDGWTVAVNAREDWTLRTGLVKEKTLTRLRSTRGRLTPDPRSGVVHVGGLGPGTYDVLAQHFLRGPTQPAVVELGPDTRTEHVVLRSFAPDSERILRARVHPSTTLSLDPSKLRAVHQGSRKVVPLRQARMGRRNVLASGTVVEAIDVEPGRYRLTYLEPGFEDWQSDEFETGAEAQITVDTEARLAVELVGGSDRIRERLPVTCEEVGPRSGLRQRSTAWSDGNGTVQLNGLAPGTWRVRIELSHWNVVTREVELRRGDQRVQLEIPRTGTLRVSRPVLDKNRPATLFASDGTRTTRVGWPVREESRWVWTIEGLPIGGELTLQAARPRPDLGDEILGGVGPVVVRTVDEGVAELNLEGLNRKAVPASIRLTMAGRPLPEGQWGVLLVPQGSPGLNSIPEARRTFPAVDGVARLSPLPEARYALVVQHDGQSWPSGRVVVFVPGFVPSATLDIPSSAFAPR